MGLRCGRPGCVFLSQPLTSLGHSRAACSPALTPSPRPPSLAHADHASSSALFTWGLNNPHGRLAHGALPPSRFSPSSLDPSVPPAVALHAHEPKEVALPLRQVGLEEGAGEGEAEGRWELGEVECGMESLWVELRVEEDVD